MSEPVEFTDAQAHRLLARYLAGDTDAFGELARASYDRMWAVAPRVCGGDPDEAAVVGDLVTRTGQPVAVVDGLEPADAVQRTREDALQSGGGNNRVFVAELLLPPAEVVRRDSEMRRGLPLDHVGEPDGSMRDAARHDGA